jgi:hypothetical protein
MRKRAGADFFLALGVAVLGCGHVLHPAAVVPGPVLDFQVGAELPEHRPRPDAAAAALRSFDPYRSTDLMVQGAFSYGWRFSEDRALQLALSIGNRSAPSLDLYWQLLGGGLDAGAGLTAGAAIMFSGYAMVGRAFDLGEDRQLRLDGGYRYAPLLFFRGATGHGPMALFSFAARPMGVGLWLDHIWFSRTITSNYCDDLCEVDDTVANRLSLGAFMRLQF